MNMFNQPRKQLLVALIVCISVLVVIKVLQETDVIANRTPASINEPIHLTPPAYELLVTDAQLPARWMVHDCGNECGDDKGVDHAENTVVLRVLGYSHHFHTIIRYADAQMAYKSFIHL